MSIFYVDPLCGSDALTGDTWTDAWRTVCSGATSGRINPGDTIRIRKSELVYFGASAVFASSTALLTLETTAAFMVNDCSVKWTQGGSVTASNAASSVRNSACAFTIVAAFTTGIVGYYNYAPGALDLSGYSVVNFWFKNSANIAASGIRIDFCTDTAGNTPVVSVYNPTGIAAGTLERMEFHTVTGLPNSVKSVALCATVDPGAVTWIIDEMFVTKTSTDASYISFYSTLGNTSTSLGTFFPIASMSGREVYFGSIRIESGVSALLPWGGWGTGSLPLYTISPYVIPTAITVPKGGTISTGIVYEGGWERTAGVRNGMTFFKTDTDTVNYIFVSAWDNITIKNIISYSYSFSADSTVNNVNLENIVLHDIYNMVYSPSSSYIKNSYFISCNPLQLGNGLSIENTKFTWCFIGAAASTYIQDRVQLKNCHFSYHSYNYSLSQAGQNPPQFYDCDFTGATYTFQIAGRPQVYLFNTPYNNYDNPSNTDWVIRSTNNLGYSSFLIQYGSNLSGSKYLGAISDQINALYTTGYAKGSTGLCVTFNPQITAIPLQYEFNFPVQPTATTLKFYMSRTTGFNGVINLEVYDSRDQFTILTTATLDTSALSVNSGVGGASDWAYQFASSAFTATITGLAKAKISVYQGTTTTGDVFLDDISVV